MGKIRQVNTDFWVDSYVEGLNTDEKLLFLYLMTSPHGNLAGCYSIAVRNISCDTGLTPDAIKSAMERLCSDGKVYYKDNVFAFKNGIKRASLTNWKIANGIKEVMEKMPEEVKEFTSYRLLIDSLSIGDISDIDTSNKNKNKNKSKSNNSSVLSTNKKEEKKKDTRIKILMDYFFNKHLEVRKTKVSINGGKDGNIFEELLKNFTEDEIKDRINKFMVYSDDWMIKNQIPYTIGQFKVAFDKVAVEVKQKVYGIDDGSDRNKYKLDIISSKTNRGE